MDKKNTGLFIPVLISTVLWASTFPAISLCLRDYPPMVLAVLRYSLAFAPLLFILWRRMGIRSVFGALKRDWRLFSLMGILTVTIPQVLQNYSMLWVSSSLTSMIQATSPVFGVAVGITILHEKSNPEKVLGVSIALLGAVLLSLGEDLSFSDSSTFWAVLILLSAASYGISGLYFKRGLNRYDPLSITALSILPGILYSLPLLLLPAERAWMANPVSSGTSLLLLFYLAFIPTTFAMILWFGVLSKMELSRLVPFTYLTPLFATIMGIVLLDETITLWTVLSAAFVVAGVMISQKRPGREKDMHLLQDTPTCSR